MTSKPLRWVGAAVALVAICSAAGVGVMHWQRTRIYGPGPLGSYGGYLSDCRSVPPHVPITMGARVLADPMPDPLTIDSVKLRQPGRVHLVRPPELAPLRSRTSAGTYLGYPRSMPDTGVDWTHRRSAVGATLPPHGDELIPRNAYTLVIEVARNGDGNFNGYFRGVIIDYHIAGRHYQSESSFGAVLYKDSCAVPKSWK